MPSTKLMGRAMAVSLITPWPAARNSRKLSTSPPLEHHDGHCKPDQRTQVRPERPGRMKQAQDRVDQEAEPQQEDDGWDAEARGEHLSGPVAGDGAEDRRRDTLFLTL